MKTQFAIFTTSEIFQYQSNWPAGRVVYDNSDEGHDRPTVLVSTGMLEKAIEQGYTPVVASTRGSLGRHDQWWVDLVEQANGKVFLADSNSQDDVSTGWRKLCDFLGEEWPTREWNDEPEFWTAVRHKLNEKYKSGYNFETSRWKDD